VNGTADSYPWKVLTHFARVVPAVLHIAETELPKIVVAPTLEAAVGRHHAGMRTTDREALRGNGRRRYGGGIVAVGGAWVRA
jgi:hypothetical protein